YGMADEYIKVLFDDMVYKSPDYETIGVTGNNLAIGLDAWLDKLSSDLDDLDIDHQGKYSLDLKIFNARSHKLRVLHENFRLNANRLDYLWVGKKDTILEQTGEEILKVLQQYERDP